MNDEQRSKAPEIKSVMEDPVYYANRVHFSTRPYDITLRFFQEIHFSADQAPDTRDGVIVMMSPQLAKEVVRILGRQIDDYEEQIGSLPDVGSLTADNGEQNGEEGKEAETNSESSQ